MALFLVPRSSGSGNRRLMPVTEYDRSLGPARCTNRLMKGKGTKQGTPSEAAAVGKTGAGQRIIDRRFYDRPDGINKIAHS
jgi:hypothetical protein